MLRLNRRLLSLEMQTLDPGSSSESQLGTVLHRARAAASAAWAASELSAAPASVGPSPEMFCTFGSYETQRGQGYEKVCLSDPDY